MNWFQASFGERYVQLYAHRDAAEAARTVDLLYPDAALLGRRVLDLACGGGRYLAQLQARGARAIGLDLSSVLLRRARRITRTGSLVRADMRRLPLRDAAVQTTWCMFTSFGYFDTVEAHRELAREIARVTQEDLVLDLPDRETLRASLVESSERRIPGWRVTERRWIESEPMRVCKTMIWIDEESGVERERYEEHVFLFCREDIAEFFAPAGLFIDRSYGDYDGVAYAPGSSPRMVLHLRRGATG